MFVYFIGCEHGFKVGITRDVQQRLGGLQFASPVKLEILGHWYALEAFRIERAIHQALGDFHSHGEWFKPGGRAIADRAVLSLLAEGLLIEVTPELLADLDLAFWLGCMARRCTVPRPVVTWDEKGSRHESRENPIPLSTAAAESSLSLDLVEQTVRRLVGRSILRAPLDEISPLLDRTISILERDGPRATSGRIRSVIAGEL